MDELLITPEMDQRNGRLFMLSYVLIYFAAPVLYIDVVQATLCNKLGASATVANLPAGLYFAGGIAPIICSLLVPYRLERAMVVISSTVITFIIGLVCITLLLRLPPGITIFAVVLQGLLVGLGNGISGVYTLQCLARGTTLVGRARALKRTFSVTPLFAVLGSLGAQYILKGGFSRLPFPFDFALLYFVAGLCMVGVTLVSTRYELAHIPDKPYPPPLPYLGTTLREFFSSKPLLILFIVYLLWNCSLSGISNLALFSPHATHKDPADLAGAMMALRFGCKAIAGLILGSIALRWGMRASVITTSVFLVIGFGWGWLVPGLAFLLAFGFMGAGELGGAYIPNYGLTLARPEFGVRALSILTFAQGIAGLAPTLHGALADHFGFHASFTFGILAALAAIWLTLRIHPPRNAPV